MVSNMMNKYNVTYEALSILYDNNVRKSMHEKILEKANYPRAKVDRIIKDNKEKNRGNVNDRTKWSEEFRFYNTQKVKANRAVVCFEKIAFPGIIFEPRGGKRISSKNTKQKNNDINKMPIYKKGFEFATYPLAINFDKNDGPSLSFEEKNISHSIFNGVIKYFQMTSMQYQEILQNVKQKHPEMLLPMCENFNDKKYQSDYEDFNEYIQYDEEEFIDSVENDSISFDNMDDSFNDNNICVYPLKSSHTEMVEQCLGSCKKRKC